MQIKKDELKIIQLLLSSQNYISSYDIATSVGISRRLVRDKMAHIKTILASLNLNLISTSSKGYYIEGKSSKDLTQLQSLFNDTERNEDNLIPTLPDDRAAYINNRLIDSNSYIKLEQLADELVVSRATIANDLIGCKKEGSKYGLKYIHKPNYGIYVEGKEINKRKVLVDTIFRNLYLSDMYFDFLDAYLYSSDYKIIQIINEYHIEMSDLSLIDFLISLSVIISRISTGHTLENPIEDFIEFIDREEYFASQEIAEYVSKKFEIVLNEYEIQSITILLICKRSTKGLIQYPSALSQMMITEILQKIYDETLISFNDTRFLNIFPLYIQYTLVRQKYNEKVRTPLYQNIQYDFPLAYHLAQIVSQTIKSHTHTALSKSELTNFTILFNNNINMKRENKTKVLLINCMSESIRHFLTFNLNKELYNLLEIKKSIRYHQLLQEDLSQYDLIISSAPIHHQLDIPVINIHYIITNEDIIRIKSQLSYLFNDEQIIYYFHPTLYETHIRVKTMKGIASTFYHMIKKLYPMLNESKKNDIMDKNKTSLHVFNQTIGLITMNRPLISRNIVSVITLEEPIHINNQTFQIVVLFSCLDNQNIMYNTLFTTIKNLSTNNNDLKQLSKQLSYTEFLSILLRNK